MTRRIMTNAENERQKQRLRALLPRGRYIFEAYPEPKMASDILKGSIT